MSELQTLKCYLSQVPATIIQLLGINPPLDTISEPVQPIIEMYEGIDRISINMIDNFGLFEITYHKPQFMITNSEVMLLLSTKNPYTLGVFHQLMFGGFEIEPNGFHLLRYLNDNGRKSCFIARKKDLRRYDGLSQCPKKLTCLRGWNLLKQSINTTYHGCTIWILKTFTNNSKG